MWLDPSDERKYDREILEKYKDLEKIMLNKMRKDRSNGHAIQI